MSSSFGKNLKITLFGESHGEQVGAVVDGIAPGLKIDFDQLQIMLNRRKPGQGALTTQRSESDIPQIVSGVVEGVTTGTPICALFQNKDTKSKDYSLYKEVARPGHTDFVANERYNGFQDVRGGGHFSARITAGLVFAGALAKQQLEQEGILICSHIARVGSIEDKDFPLHLNSEQIRTLQNSKFPLLDTKIQALMEAEILSAKEQGDSVGGQIGCMVLGLPAGLGDPFFDSVESVISHLVFSIPAVKAIEFGTGVKSAQMLGSTHNPSLRIENGDVVETTNHNGGILGGITNGMPLVFKATFKPTPSIAKEQQTVNFQTKEEVNLKIKGRHDPCVALRAAPVVEAAAAIAVLDIYMGRQNR